MDADFYDYPKDYKGRKVYVSVNGHSNMVPKYKTYMGANGHYYLTPEHGGDYSGLGGTSTYIIPDKAPYQSPLDGSMVEGRVQHREHMRVHDVIEVGDTPIGYGSKSIDTPPAGHDIVRAIKELEGR